MKAKKRLIDFSELKSGDIVVCRHSLTVAKINFVTKEFEKGHYVFQLDEPAIFLEERKKTSKNEFCRSSMFLTKNNTFVVISHAKGEFHFEKI